MLRHWEVSALISFKMALLSHIRCSQRIRNTVIVSTRWDSPFHFHATFVPYSEFAPPNRGVADLWNVFTCSSQPRLVPSNLPSLKEVIRSNTQYKKHNLLRLSVCVQKGRETAEFHKELGSANWRLLQPSFLHFLAKREQHLRFTLERLSPLLIDSPLPPPFLHPDPHPVHLFRLFRD